MKMKPFEFIALSACTMTLTALGIDIMLPAFAEIRGHFGLSSESTATAQIISFFFMGQVAQIGFGILSDRMGRLPVLRIGFPLYIIGGVIAAFAPSLEIMYAARFLAGMGASAVFTSTIAGIRDRFAGDEMARVMSLVLTIFLFTPILAPFLGLAILSFASWQAVFLTPPLFAVAVFLWSLRLDESLAPGQRVSAGWQQVISSVRSVLQNKVFLRYMAVTTVLFAALSSYVASAERIVGEIYKSPHLFAWIFAGIGLIMSMSSLLNSRLSAQFGARFTLRKLAVGYACVAFCLLIFTLVTTDPPLMWVFFIGVALQMAINLAIEPNSSALALEPLGDKAGLAAAVYGTCFFFAGASLGSVISYYLVEGVFALVLSFFLIGLVTIVLVFGDRRPLLRKVPVN